MSNEEIINALQASEEMHVLLYSPSQNAFHIETFRDHINRNIQIICQVRSTDYMMVGIYPSRQSAMFTYSKILNSARKPQLSELTVDELLKSL